MSFVQLCRQYAPYPSPCAKNKQKTEKEKKKKTEKKKKRKKRKKKKRKKIPCTQWCRTLAWGNRLQRPTD